MHNDENDGKNSQSIETDPTAPIPQHHYPTPPDGGWGWAVVCGSFVCHMLTDGCAFSSGVLFTRLLNYFGKSHSSTSWVSSVFIGIPLICGPMSSSLTVRFGCRKVTIVGGLLTMIGFISASFVNSIEMICLTYGVISGIGMSMIYVPAVVIVAFYFKEKRAFATGLAVCGSGIGTATFAPLTEFLLSKYDWRVTLMILSGVFTNIIICGIIFRPLTLSREERHQIGLDTFNKIYSNASENSDRSKQSYTSRKTIFGAETGRMNSRCYSNIHIPTFLKTSHCEFDATPVTKQLVNGDFRGVKDCIVALFPPPIDSSHTRSSVSLNSVLLKKHDRRGLYIMESSSHTDGDNVINLTTRPKHEKLIQLRREHDIQLATRSHYSRIDIFYRGNPVNLSLSCPDIVISQMKSAHILNLHHIFCSTLKFLIADMTDFTDLKNPLFFIFSISNFILYFWYDVPYVFLGHYAIELGSTASSGSLLITIIGVVNTIGQITFGHIADQKGVNNIAFYSTTIILCGVSVMIIAFCKSYVGIAVLAAVFGFFVSSNYAITTILLVDFVGMHRLTKSYGVLLFMTGVANLVGPPVAGWLYDISGNYDNTFIAAGGFISAAGFMVLICLLQRVAKYRHCHVPIADIEVSMTSPLASTTQAHS